jgi:hypothetical protein
VVVLLFVDRSGSKEKEADDPEVNTLGSTASCRDVYRRLAFLESPTRKLNTPSGEFAFWMGFNGSSQWAG